MRKDDKFVFKYKKKGRFGKDRQTDRRTDTHTHIHTHTHRERERKTLRFSAVNVNGVDLLFLSESRCYIIYKNESYKKGSLPKLFIMGGGLPIS